MADNRDHECSICATCGTQYAPSAEPPSECAICRDARQFVALDGQRWTTLQELRRKYSNRIQEEEAGLFSIHTQPNLAISEQAFLVRTSEGNILWDCISLLDEPTIGEVKKLGGIAAIAISHPHYYTTMVEWSLAFDNAPIFLHQTDRQWVMRAHENIRFWSGERRKHFRAGRRWSTRPGTLTDTKYCIGRRERVVREYCSAEISRRCVWTRDGCRSCTAIRTLFRLVRGL